MLACLLALGDLVEAASFYARIKHMKTMRVEEDRMDEDRRFPSYRKSRSPALLDV